MTRKIIKTLRTQSFRAQRGRCYYCGQLMWLRNPDELGLGTKAGRPWQCTAEHLIAQQDGGRHIPGNIVAAHAICNQRRHKRSGRAPDAVAFRDHIRRRMTKGKWLQKPGLQIGSPHFRSPGPSDVVIPKATKSLHR